MTCRSVYSNQRNSYLDLHREYAFWVIELVEITLRQAQGAQVLSDRPQIR